MLDKSKKETLEYIAKITRENLNLNVGCDAFRVISNLEKYIIIRFPSSVDELSGFSLKKGKYRCIYINSSHVLGRQYFSCWHEYYHCINDLKEMKISYYGDSDKEEKEADYFASCMLMPKEEIENYIIINRKDIKEYNEDDLIKMQYKFRVSFQALLFRLKDIYECPGILKYLYLSNLKNKDIYLERIKKNGFGIDMVLPTNDSCVGKSFFKDLESNLIKNRINLFKVEQIMNIVKDEEIKGEWE